jgi:myotubularin-related protein 6/7/8
MRGKRSVQDERLVAAICNTSKILPKAYKSAPATPLAGRSTSDLAETSPSALETNNPSTDTESADDDAANSISQESATSDDPSTPTAKVYGAQQHNLIIDARPTINAYAMQAVGMGSENMENYRCASKRNLGIDNIHVMRSSLDDVVEAFRETDLTPLSPNKDLLQKSGWLKHIANVLEGTRLIAHTVGIMHSHVLIHCSDGWDRTSQLSALAQLCLDPYFRTLEGFMVLVEKDWLSFGHMFRHRSGFLSSEKWFEIEGERVGGDRAVSNGQSFGSAGGSGNALENALTRAKGLFGQKPADDADDLSDSELEAQLTDSGTLVNRKRSQAPAGSHHHDGKIITKPRELSPVFHQFLDATYQMLYQYPTRFEFNERFLKRLYYHLYSCQYGTFLWDNERERVENEAKKRTQSVWQYFLSRRDQFVNPNYDPTVDDNIQGKERIIFPDPQKVRWWAFVFGREDSEMNLPSGPSLPAQTAAARPNPEAPSSLPEDFEKTAIHSGFDTPPEQMLSGTSQRSRPQNNGPLSKAASERLSAGLASLGIGKGHGSPAGSRPRSPKPDRELDNMGVEMS